MPLNKNMNSNISYKEYRPGRFAKFRNGKFISFATNEEIEAHLETEGYIESRKSNGSESVFEIDEEKITFHEILQLYSSLIQNLTKQLMFVSSILAGFLFTIIFDLITAPQNTNNILLSVIFSLLLVSGFSFLVTIVISAILQFSGNTEYLGFLKYNDKLKMLFSEVNEKSEEAIDFVEPIFAAFMWGSLGALIAFLFGILCFILSITILGWIRSPWFGFLSTTLTIGLIYITFYLVKKIVLEINK